MKNNLDGLLTQRELEIRSRPVTDRPYDQAMPAASWRLVAFAFAACVAAFFVWRLTQ